MPSFGRIALQMPLLEARVSERRNFRSKPISVGMHSSLQQNAGAAELRSLRFFA